MLSHFLRAASSGPTFIGYTYAIAASSSSTTVSVAVPTGAQAGDILVASGIAGSSSSTWTGGAGFTETLDTMSRYQGYLVWDGITSPFTFTQSATGSGEMAVILMAFRNFSFDVQGALSSGSGSPTAPAATLTSNNSIVIASFNTVNGTASYTTPAGFTEIYDSSAGLATFYKSGVASGSTGTVTSNASNGGNHRGNLVGLKP
jgi:hypothetical protein